MLMRKSGFLPIPRSSSASGILYDKMGMKTESMARMKEVIALTPDDPQALNYLGYTYAEMGTNLDEALQYLKKAVKLRPDDGFILDSLGWVYFKLKRYDDALLNLESGCRTCRKRCHRHWAPGGRHLCPA